MKICDQVRLKTLQHTDISYIYHHWMGEPWSKYGLVETDHGFTGFAAGAPTLHVCSVPLSVNLK
jgi:hypothetical protein